MNTQSTTTQTKIDQSLRLAYLAAQAAIDKKAENVCILDLQDQSSFTDYFLICSAYSDRQVNAICDAIKSRVIGEGFEVLSTEGYTEGRWVIMDLGDIVVHVFMDAIREYYNIESLWSRAVQVPIPPELYTDSHSSSLN